MKWFAILLLMVNVVLFGWQFNERLREKTIAAAGIPPLSPRTPGLRLVSELAELPELRADAAELEAGTNDENEPVLEAVDLSTELNTFGDPSDNCISVGPITDDQQLANFKFWLRLRATAVHTQVETVRQRRFFWVYLEPASDAEAIKNLSDLERRGVTDYLLIRRGGLKNAISLGLFRSQDSVNRRLAEMTRQGYKPVVVPKFKTTENYWVRATMAEGFEDMSIVPPDLIGDATLEPIDCARIADMALSGAE